MRISDWSSDVCSSDLQPEYKAAVTILDYRHVCRLDDWPAALKRSMAGINMDIYGTMWGPNEFNCIGSLKDWDRLADLHRVKQPALVLCGMHDELTPDSAARVARALPDARLKVFRSEEGRVGNESDRTVRSEWSQIP